MSQTAARPFREWLQAQLELRGIVGPGEAAKATGLNQSLLSRYLAGEIRPSRKSVIAIAGGLKTPVADVQAAVDNDPERFRAAQPPPAGVDDMRALLGTIADQLRRYPAPVAYTQRPSTGPARAVVLHDPAAIAALLAAVDPDAGVVVWIADAQEPRPGEWVRVGDPWADPPALKPYEPGDPVTGVVHHFQGWARA